MKKSFIKAMIVASVFAGGAIVTQTQADADSFVTDVSSHQGVINYKANGFNGVIIKAGGGETASGNYVNPYVGLQQAEARREGIQHGFYYYLTSNVSPERQAQQFVNILGNQDARNKDIPVFVDVEENAWDGNHFRGDEPKRFMDKFYNLTGKKVNVYMNYEMATGMHGRFEWSDIKNAKLWLALYPSSNNTQYYGQEWANQKFAQIPWFKTVNMWQYGDGGGLDRNIQYGDWSDLTGHKYNPSTPVQETTPPNHKPTTPAKPSKTASIKNDVDYMRQYGIVVWNKKWFTINETAYTQGMSQVFSNTLAGKTRKGYANTAEWVNNGIPLNGIYRRGNQLQFKSNTMKIVDYDKKSNGIAVMVNGYKVWVDATQARKA